jgi:citrate lyase subunit alpha/citrate CoA-transferase
MINAAGREIPEFIEGYGRVKPFEGAFAQTARYVRAKSVITSRGRGENKLLSSISEALERVGLRDGMTISFHHHFRNGDRVVNLVMEAVAAKGLKDIHVAASGIFPCHEPLVELIENDVITQVSVSTFNPGPVAKAISKGKLKKPAILRTHGGRPRAIESGELHIDVAFIAAPSSDAQGNLNGTHGKSACGYLSYAYADAFYADQVVAITDELVDYPNCPIEIGQDYVDYIVVVESTGNPEGIISGTTKITEDPEKLRVASQAAELMRLTGYLKNGMTFQTGAGGISLAVAAEVRRLMIEGGIVGAFGAGGIHAYFVKMLNEGLFKALFDVQCFDLEAIKSAAENPRHMSMSGSMYGNPHTKGCVVNNLDVIILGAAEIDTAFNVNVITGTNGVILGASGGHSDCAAGAKLTVIVSELLKGKYSVVRDRVTTVTTPGETVDVLVTDRGIAVNPARKDILGALKNSDLPLVEMGELLEIAESRPEKPEPAVFSERIVGVVEYRDGTVIDVVRQPL